LGENANGCLCAAQPVKLGVSDFATSGRTYRKQLPGPPHIHLSAPPTMASTERACASSGTMPPEWKTSSTTNAPCLRAFATIGSTSVIAELRNITWSIATSSVSSSIAAATCSPSVAMPSAAGPTRTSRAPCAARAS